MKHRHLVILLLALCCMKLSAQETEYLYEIGPGIGMSWAYGDVNRSSALYDASTACNFTWRYNPNLRWAIAVDVSQYHLKGDSRDFSNTFIGKQTWEFDRQCWQLGIRPEFSFWNYGWGADYREKHRLAPYLTTGIGVAIVNGKSTGGAGESYIMTWPVGLGLKWKMAPRWDMQLAGMWSKCFGDDADGIIDPYHIGTTSPAHTDWIGSVMLSITFSFKERCFECHNQNQ